MASEAKIFTKYISSSRIISALSKEAEGIRYAVSIPKVYYEWGSIPVVIEDTQIFTVYTSGVQYIPLKGDFSESIVLANDYDGSKYGGYDLFTNNCAHYAQEILKAGTSNNSRIEEFLETSNVIIPKDLYDYLYTYSK